MTRAVLLKTNNSDLSITQGPPTWRIDPYARAGRPATGIAVGLRTVREKTLLCSVTLELVSDEDSVDTTLMITIEG